ncbi:hypothetical protein [Staphylococcus caprae]|uniref:hypothetical protein n=1 Tax=Staphylococcus caprae TaxID=29380 RepID=UPI0014525D05|nr:hypothetical protein [Staphylococcus caprae]QJE26654.1 hypothetical protein HHJ99_12860 [Staphylococcus caprae]HEK6547224.1 hypothetical protein [Staphylococcus aureus]
MDNLKLTYNNQIYQYKVAPYFDGIGIAITLFSQRDNVCILDAIQTVSVPPIIEPQENDWVIIDNMDYPSIENVLIENNIINPNKVDEMKVGLNDYPCYQLTTEAYNIYQNAKSLMVVT